MAQSAGMDRNTGRLIQDWPSVAQSLGDIFSTPFGQRVMRRYYGSAVPLLLGENMVPETFVRFFAALGMALVQEPRVALTQILPLSVSRTGRAGFRLEMQYRPRGHLGDFTPAGAKHLNLVGNGPTFSVQEVSL